MAGESSRRDKELERLSQLGIVGTPLEELIATVRRNEILLGKLMHEVGSGNVLYGIEDPTTTTDITTHAAIAGAHHIKYLDSEAIAAVPFIEYISFGSEPISGQSYAP